MPTIQLPYLDETLDVQETDLVLTRKSGQDTDNKIKFSNLCKSIGNSSILGYKATVYAEPTQNEIIIRLETLNNVPIPYTLSGSSKIPSLPDNTLIFFSFPVDFKGIMSLRILDKTYTLVYSNDGSRYFSCMEGEHFVVKFAPTLQFPDRFVKINDYEDIIATNIYDITDITTNPGDITISLVSSFGVQKQRYIKGMEIIFVPTQTIVSNNIKVIIDELGFTRQALRFIDSSLQTTLIKDREVRAIYDGTKFVITSYDYPSLVPGFLYRTNVSDYSYFNFKNRFYDNIASYPISFSIGNDYATIEEAIADIEQRFGWNKQNIKVRLIIDSVDLTKTIVIDRDLSYIELYPLNNNTMTFNSTLFADMFHIINDGKFFSVFYNAVINLRSTATTDQPKFFDFIRIQNNASNIFEKFLIQVKDLAPNVKLSRIFLVYMASGGITIKDVLINSDSGASYVSAINFAVYSSNAFLYNVSTKNWESVGLEIGYSVNSQPLPHNHKIFIVSCDFSKINTASNQDIIFRLQNGYGYTLLNQVASKAGCNITANTSNPDWGWYTRSGDGNTKGSF